MEKRRPSSEELLEIIQREQKEMHNGKLKIFLDMPLVWGKRMPCWKQLMKLKKVARML